MECLRIGLLKPSGNYMYQLLKTQKLCVLYLKVLSDSRFCKQTLFPQTTLDVETHKSRCVHCAEGTLINVLQWHCSVPLVLSFLELIRAL